MDYQSIAKECIQDGLHIPDMVVNGNPSDREKENYQNLFDHIRRARIDSFVKATRVAEGTDPSSIPIKCYAPCHEQVGTDSVFSDFKDEGSIKEYRLSGMCQKCQDHIFG